jgi:hypothetical protein
VHGALERLINGIKGLIYTIYIYIMAFRQQQLTSRFENWWKQQRKPGHLKKAVRDTKALET